LPAFSAIPLEQLSKRSKTLQETTSGVRKRNLQVATLICMPSPLHDVDPSAKTRMPDEAEYHIGLTEVFCYWD
jgi:hypothetical protein